MKGRPYSPRFGFDFACMQELTNGKKVCLGVSNEEAMLDIQAVARKKGDCPLHVCWSYSYESLGPGFNETL
jgi:hypothetical protein